MIAAREVVTGLASVSETWMPHHTPLIATVVIGLVVAFFMGAIAHRLRVSPVAGYLFAGGTIAYLVLVPAIKFFGEGLAEPLFPATMLIKDMSAGQVRSNYIFYIGAGAVASAGIIALLRALPTIVSAFRSGFQDLKGTVGTATTRLHTDLDLPIWVTIAGSIGLALLLSGAATLLTWPRARRLRG